MLPEPVPPYTRFTLEEENVLTLASLARGRAPLLFISSAAPSASTCWARVNPYSTISSAELKSEVKYWAFASAFSSSQNVPPTNAATVLSNFWSRIETGMKTTIRTAQTIVRIFHARTFLRFAFL